MIFSISLLKFNITIKSIAFFYYNLARYIRVKYKRINRGKMYFDKTYIKIVSNIIANKT